MASTPIRWLDTSGITGLTAKLVDEADTLVATFSGGTAPAEQTNAKGIYEVTHTGTETGRHYLLVYFSTEGDHLTFLYDLEDSTTVHYPTREGVRVSEDVTLIHADTDELQTDWVDAGRLDAILDTIAADVVNIDGAAMRGTDSAALASVCTAARLAELDAANLPADIDQIKADLPNLPTKNVQLTAFTFFMASGSTAKTGLSVTAQISKDGGALATCSNSVAEISNGLYTITLTATEMNADVVTLRFSATNADDRIILLLTHPT
jgi:hypothetical protein